MDCRADRDLFFLPDEKFDFDVSLSPASSKGDDEDEDEVFLGPLSHKERCVSVNVASRLEGGVGVRASWSPLTGDQLEAVCQEAHKLADQLRCADLPEPHGEDVEPTDAGGGREEFLQDNKAKLSVLAQTAITHSPIKRQTFLVQDSPLKELPPAVQRRLLRGSAVTGSPAKTAPSHRTASANTPSVRPSSTASSKRLSSASTAPSTRPAAASRLSTASPGVGVKGQPRAGLRGKATLGVVLPSKPSGPATSCLASKSKVEKSRLQPPSKVGDKVPAAGSWKRSPSSRASSRAGSCEDLLSDSASVASDVSDTSLNSSLVGKRTMAPPSKTFTRSLSAVKVAPLQSRRVTDRKNTSSSSSSVSSFNSSISSSPAKGKLNSSLNRSLSASTGPAPSSITKPANPSRPNRTSVYGTAAPPPPPNATRRSLSTQVRRPSEVERSKTTKSTPLKRAVTTPLQVTPAKRVSEKVAPIQANATTRLQSAAKAKSKPEALVLPTPSGGFRGVAAGDEASTMMRPKRLGSTSSIDGLPQKPSAGPMTPSAGSGRSLQMKARRPSALPTPVKRQVSAIPQATPTNLTRPTRPVTSSDAGPAPCSSATKSETSCSPAPSDTQEAEPVVTEVKPFCLEEEEEPAPPPSPPHTDQSESCTEPAPEPVHQDQSPQVKAEPSRDLIELESAESNAKTQEVLLLDLPAPVLQPQEKLLIDLTNTPDLIRTSHKTCTNAQQLIDLSSPLIRWSPEDKSENNNAPLINLSF